MKAIKILSGILMLAAFITGVADATVLYSDDFSGDGSGNLVGTTPDVSRSGDTWSGFTIGTIWQDNGAITNANNAKRNMFLPFVPESNKVYTAKIDVVRIGETDSFSFGFTTNDVANDGFPLAGDLLGASPWMTSAGVNGKVNTYTGPANAGAGTQEDVPNPDNFNTLEMVLNTSNATWTVEFFLNGASIRGPEAFSANPDIQYVGFGRYNTGTFQVDNFELSVYPDLPEPPTIETVLYSDDFSGDGSGGLVGTTPDVTTDSATWSGLEIGTIWQDNGSITNNNNQRRNVFLPFTPEIGKIYTAKIDVVRIGADHSFGFGFTETDTANAGFPLDSDDLKASPWMTSYAVNGNVDSFLGPDSLGAGEQVAVDDPDVFNTLEMVLSTWEEPWTVEFFLNGESIRGPEAFSSNPTNINYIGFGRYNTGTFTVDNFELSALGYAPGEIGLVDIASVTGTNALTLSWATSSGASYAVQNKTNLVDDLIWHDFLTGIPGTGGSVTITTAVDQVQSFYRIIAE